METYKLNGMPIDVVFQNNLNLYHFKLKPWGQPAPAENETAKETQTTATATNSSPRQTDKENNGADKETETIQLSDNDGGAELNLSKPQMLTNLRKLKDGGYLTNNKNTFAKKVLEIDAKEIKPQEWEDIHVILAEDESL